MDRQTIYERRLKKYVSSVSARSDAKRRLFLEARATTFPKSQIWNHGSRAGPPEAFACHPDSRLTVRLLSSTWLNKTTRGFQILCSIL